MTQQSSMPPPEQIEDLVLMKIVQVVASDYPASREQLTVEVDNVYPGAFEQIDALVYTIDHPELKGLLPSRIWYHDDRLVLMFYVNATLPKEARPLGENAFCVFDLEVSRGASVRYDIYTQVFIDQIRDDATGRMNYVFVCAEPELKKLLAARKED